MMSVRKLARFGSFSVREDCLTRGSFVSAIVNRKDINDSDK